jgi:hypothetical protein
MGMFHFFSTGSKPGDVIRPGNPNPAKFTIERTEQCGPHLVAQIRYHGVTNYEGRKIIVYLNRSEQSLRDSAWIDPHFQDDERYGGAPFARFEPTELGWANAIGMLDGFF